jgi:phosphopantothenate-cysteine ligase
MNVLVTSGGTQESIDAVRSITNTSTGALGSLIAECFDNEVGVDSVFYLAGPAAKLPAMGSGKIQLVPIINTVSLESELRALLSTHKIDVIIHAMAVSDFRVTKVTSLSRVVDALDMAGAFDNAVEFDRSGKIGSNLNGDKLLVVMEETPKIIAMLRTLAPSAVIVGFKLLNGVNEETLIDTAYALLKNNACNFVLANDAKNIHGGNHTGFLIDAKKNISRMDTKSAIAAEIVSKVMEMV